MIRSIITGCISVAVHFTSNAQKLTSLVIRDSLISVENNNSIAAPQKLKILYWWKKESEISGLPQDSVYAKLLYTLGVYEVLVNKNYNSAVAYTLTALKINNSGRKDCSKLFAINSCYQAAFYYDRMLLLNEALKYYDSTIRLAQNLSYSDTIISDAKLYKAYIFFRTGDYQKSIEESSTGIDFSLKRNDSLYYLRFLNQRSQSLFFEGKLSEALSDVDNAIYLAQKLHQTFQLASAFKMKGFIYAAKKDFAVSESSFLKSITERIETKNDGAIAGDYNDFGNFFRDNIRNFEKAKKCYFSAIKYAQKINDSVRLSKLQLNLGKTFFHEHRYSEAEQAYLNAMKYLDLITGNNFFVNPRSGKINLIGNKELTIVLFACKAELLLHRFTENNDKKYLRAVLETALLTDSIITQTRHEQIGEQSKLYWRDRTRDFFTNAIEACYLANDAKLAFFFMEKSRAVLLNDKLNELGAAAHLPKDEAEKQERLQVNVVEQQQMLSTLYENTPGYNSQQQKLLQAKDEAERYIKSLEQKYPIYYQYKYADKVPSLNELQKLLVINKQSFVHYFINDTVAYILGITPDNTKLLRLNKNDFNSEQLAHFLQLCSDKQALNNNYPSFAALSNNIYKSIFEPLQLPKGRLVICTDNFLIPFEALCSDADGKRFLLYDYAFSYVYSARYLMKQFNNPSGKGNFLGIAPVSFAGSMHVNTLSRSAEALKASAVYYPGDKLLTEKNATRKNFIQQIPNYTVVNVFSHARADSSDSEPELFMRDSVIHLSELQLLNDPATRLVVLSACQTNVGKNATGEGIYSLARGFASAGIPSVAATLWKADELTIYAISEKFHQYLSQGMNKDEALQQAKLYFIQNGDNEKMLPYYWANMILMGDAKPLKLAADHTVWWWIATGIGALIFALILLQRRNAKNKL